MTDDLSGLRAAWHAAPTPPVFDPARLDALRDEARTMDRTLLWRDVREVLVAALLAAFFAFQLGRPAGETSGTPLGLAVLCGAALWIGGVLLAVRLRYERPAPGASVREALESERDRFAAQAALLRWAWLWYVLPIWAGLVLHNGWPHSPFGWLVFGATAAFAIGLGWLNYRVARRDLEPLRDQAAALLAELE